MPTSLNVWNASTLALATAVASCATVANTPMPAATTPVAEVAPATGSQNPLLTEWAGPYSGVPPFDRVEVAHFMPALEAAMAENLAEVAKIASNPEAPRFENTIAAMERAGRTLSRVRTVYGIWSSNLNSPEFQVVEREMAPRLAAFSDQITQNEPLFRRIEAVYNSLDRACLMPER
ncbi:hypothetical protein BH23GEM5_BH23GEM5_15120 [soil metagenome]